MIAKIHKTIPVSELRKNLSQYLKTAKQKPVVIATNRGAGARVIIDSDLYNELVDQYEDRVNATLLSKLVEEDSGTYTDLSSLKKKYDL